MARKLAPGAAGGNEGRVQPERSPAGAASERQRGESDALHGAEAPSGAAFALQGGTFEIAPPAPFGVPRSPPALRDRPP